MVKFIIITILEILVLQDIDDSYTWDQTFNPYGRDKLEEHKLNGLKPILDGGTLSWLEADGTGEEQTDGVGATKTMDFLDKFAESGENFFLAYGLYRPHVPFVAPKAYFDMYDVNDFTVPQSSNDYLKTIPKPAAISVRAKKEQVDLDPELSKKIKHAYYATTSFMDSQIGRVLDKLKETGLDKNTIVVFTSDHGYHMGEHGHWQKQTLFNDATRVPLIFAGPNIKKNNKPIEDPRIQTTWSIFQTTFYYLNNFFSFLSNKWKSRWSNIFCANSIIHFC